MRLTNKHLDTLHAMETDISTMLMCINNIENYLIVDPKNDTPEDIEIRHKLANAWHQLHAGKIKIEQAITIYNNIKK